MMRVLFIQWWCVFIHSEKQKTCPFARDGFLVVGERERDACSETGFTLKNIINTNPIN
jgi:hypothetical protein